MAKRTGPTNQLLKSAIELARKNEENLWKEVAEKLSKPTRSRVEVNISKINRHANDGETVVVPGVVLSAGNLTKKINVAAWKFSESAKEKIREAGGKILTIEELKKENPKGTNVKIMV